MQVSKQLVTLILSISLVSALFGQGAGGKAAGSADAPSTMFHVVESEKSFEQAATDLSEAVQRNGFGILHVHDLGATLRKKGIPFKEECKVFEVCNPKQAGKQGPYIREHPS